MTLFLNTKINIPLGVELTLNENLKELTIGGEFNQPITLNENLQELNIYGKFIQPIILSEDVNQDLIIKKRFS